MILIFSNRNNQYYNKYCIQPTISSTTGAQICIGTTATLYAAGAGLGDVYKWYDAATGGTILKTSANNTDNGFTTPVLASTTDYGFR